MNTFEIALTAGLCVLIWIIQVLHYPSFRFIAKEQFIQFEEFHTRRISYIVIPLMLLEIIFLFLNFRLLLFFIVGLIWLSTFLLQVPCHRKLSKGFDLNVIEKLIMTNWTRTSLWSLKLVILLKGLH